MRAAHFTPLSLLLASGTSLADGGMLTILTRPGTHELRMTLFWIVATISIIVCLLLCLAMVRYRKSKGHGAKHFHQKLSTELAWSIIPILILVLMAIPVTQALFTEQLTNKDRPHHDDTQKNPAQSVENTTAPGTIASPHPEKVERL